IAIAEIEPIHATEDGEAFQQVERLAAEAPAFFRVDDACEGVGDDIEVRANFQAVERDVVAGVYDGGHCRWIGKNIVEAEEEFGSTYAAGERRDGEGRSFLV